tara:strand:+ start:940 stop:2166 length:1227 start_codon:yes stop_codon:yes gene_type:complete
MKILFISRTFYPEGFGGGEISALHIAKLVSNSENEAIVCCLSSKVNKPTIESIGKIKVYRFPWKKLRFFKRLSNLEYVYWQLYKETKKIIKNEKPDILHFLNFQSIFPLALFFKDYTKIATINSPLFCEFGGAHPNKKTCYNCSKKERFILSLKKWGTKGIVYWTYNRYSQSLQKRSIKKCDKIFAVSNAIKKMLISENISEFKINIIHNPIKQNKKLKTNLKKILKIPANNKIILYAGRLSKDKGINRTIKAIKEIDNITFLIIGKKRDYYKKLNKIVVRLELKDKVKFIGHVKNKQIKKYYSIADLVVHPCYYYEPLSRMLLEALSFGIPIIATDVGGNKEIAKHNKNGYLIHNQKKLKESIIKILTNKKISKKFSKNALIKLEKEFSYESVSSKLLKEYFKFSKD